MRDPSARDIGAKPGSFHIGRGDVLAYTFQGGGGYGDPLRRDPQRVARDVATDFVHARSPPNSLWCSATSRTALSMRSDGGPAR